MTDDEWRAPGYSPRVLNTKSRRTVLRPGAQVRLRSRRRGDVLDLVLAGRIATLESVEQGDDGQLKLGVVVDDDQGRKPDEGRKLTVGDVEVEPTSPAGRAEPAVQTAPSVLIAGMGNVFLGDDAFGVEVIKRFVSQDLPDGVR